MKKYEFKLNPVLKIRKLKEENCRVELGQLLRYMDKIDQQIIHENGELDRYYQIQSGGVEQGVAARQIQTFPMLMAGKLKNLELLEAERKRYEKLIQQKKEELATLKGELKVIENLKEKDYTDFRKKLNKEIDEKVEEQTQIWLNFKDKK